MSFYEQLKMHYSAGGSILQKLSTQSICYKTFQGTHCIVLITQSMCQPEQHPNHILSDKHALQPCQRAFHVCVYEYLVDVHWEVNKVYEVTVVHLPEHLYSSCVLPVSDLMVQNVQCDERGKETSKHQRMKQAVTW